MELVFSRPISECLPHQGLPTKLPIMGRIVSPQNHDSDAAYVGMGGESLRKRMAGGGSEVPHAGAEGYRRARGGVQNEPHGDRLELEISV